MLKEKTYTVCVEKNKCGLRLDKVLVDTFEEFSRTRIQDLIIKGCVSLNREAAVSPSLKVREGDVFKINVPPPSEAIPAPQKIFLEVIFEDNNLVVLNKPSGLVVHPGAGNPDGTLVNALLEYCGSSLSGIGGVLRPGIVHRLDKDTSGVMVIAKTDNAHQKLSLQFSKRTIDRAYYAVVWGVPKHVEGTINTNIGRNPVYRKKMASLLRGGKKAITHYTVVQTFGGLASLVECRLSTGRTHQIRVHMSEIGHPIVGDPLYGKNRLKKIKINDDRLRREIDLFRRQALHAFLLGFNHPSSNKYMEFKVNLSSDILELCDLLKSAY